MYFQKKPVRQPSVTVFSGVGAAPTTSTPAWRTLDSVFPPIFADLTRLQQSELFFTLNFVGGSKSWQTDQLAQMPLLSMLLRTVSQVLGLSGASTSRQLLYLRAMAEYAEKTPVAADQNDAFVYSKGIVWKFETSTTGTKWSPFVKKNKTAEIGAVAAAVAQGKFKDFQKKLAANIALQDAWFGSFLDVYSTTANFNQKLLSDTGTGLTPAFFNPILAGTRVGPLNAPFPQFITGGRSAAFAALVAAVNKIVGLAPGDKRIGTATSDVLKVLRYVQVAAPQSTLGRFVASWFIWANSRYKNLRTEDTARIASQLERVGGPAKAGDTILAAFNAPLPVVVPASALKTPTAAVQQVAKTVSAEPKGPFWWEQPAAAAKTAPVAVSAAGRTQVAAAAKGVKPALVVKIAAKQTATLTGKLRGQLVRQTATLIDQKRIQEKALVVAQTAAAAAPTDPAAQAAVATAQEAVAVTTAQVQATEQAIATVDTAAAVANTAIATPDAPAATDAAAAAVAAATSEATKAATEVLPADTVADAAKQASAEVAADAVASGDPATIKATEAATDSGIIKDAVVEGAALAVEARKAAGGSSLAVLLGGAAVLYFILRR
jgi:hypothetical protein